MTQREKKARLKIRVADESIAAAQVRLRDALIAGIDTRPIRAEIAACSYQNETQRRWDLSTAILAMAVSNNESKLARLRPPAKPT